MPSFTLEGITHDYVQPEVPDRLEDIQSWEYGQWPWVEAAPPLTSGGTVDVYAEASRWAPGKILITWLDDDAHRHSAWIPKDNVQKLTASERDIIEYQNCPENLRPIRWGKRLPGFLPAD